MYIGSGDIKYLLSGKQTKGYAKLWQKFIDPEPPYYNALASPIDALRTGAILELRYLRTLPINYFDQVKVTSKEMDVFKASIDFAKIDNRKVVDFDELKTIFFTDFIDLIKPMSREPEEVYTEFLKKNFKDNYRQIQEQLFCTELEEANLVFLAVYHYEDDKNLTRDIEDKDIVKFRIKRDENIISKIKERGQIFQIVKDHFNNEAT